MKVRGDLDTGEYPMEDNAAKTAGGIYSDLPVRIEEFLRITAKTKTAGGPCRIGRIRERNLALAFP